MSKIVQYLRRPRSLLQLVVLMITMGIGIQFHLYVRQALGPAAVTIQRPPGVEGFLPIGVPFYLNRQ